MKRAYHTWDKWECYPAGFYETTAPNGMSKVEAEGVYRDLLSDLGAFEAALAKIIIEWPNSCEHYLTNDKMNRIAWLGQASLAYVHGIPSAFRGGFNKLTKDEQKAANQMALKYLNKWLVAYGAEPLDDKSAKSRTEANMY